MDKFWILLGMMGAGKSTIGKSLAAQSGREFLDTDSLLISRFGRPVSQIFQLYGESAFREHETSILRSLEPKRAVLATGGGIVLRRENWVEMQRLGTTIFLDCPIETLIERLRVSKRKRPLLAVEGWEDRLTTLLAERLPLYHQADIIVPIGEGDIEEVALRLGKVLEAG